MQSNSPTLNNVQFSENSSGLYGGGMYNMGSMPVLTDVIFIDNVTQNGGGGMNNNASHAVLNNVVFIGNSSADRGGGLYNYQSHPTLTNVTFSGNYAHSMGGGIFNSGSNATLKNVTFYENSTTGSGGGLFNSFSNPTIDNSIIWGNSPNGIAGALSTPTVSYSDIQGGYAGIGNINIDPLLGDLARNGGFTPTYSLLLGSPLIDAGNPDFCPAFDQRGLPRPLDGDSDGISVCDMGGFEYDATDTFTIFLPMILR